MITQTTTQRDTLSTMIGGYWLSQAIYVAAVLRVADHIHERSLHGADLARLTRTDQQSLVRLMRALCSVGIFRKNDTGKYEGTQLSEFLRSDSEDSLWAEAVAMGDTHYAAFGELLHTTRTAEPGFDRAFGMSFFDYLAKHGASAQAFDGAMSEMRARSAEATNQSYDFSRFRTIVDVGGADGTLITAVLNDNPQAIGILFDRPEAVARARQSLANTASRCQFIEGDFFHGVPSAADAYLLRHILHDWNDCDALKILKNCRRAVNRKGCILVVESVLPDADDAPPSLGSYLDLMMLALTGGMERTRSQFTELAKAAGFANTTFHPIYYGDMHLIELHD